MGTLDGKGNPSYLWLWPMPAMKPMYVCWVPGRFTPITCSPWKVSGFAPLNRYYITIDEVFFNNFWVIIYLLVVYKKNNNN